MSSQQKYLYMQITQDELELPLAVADSSEELGRMIGKSGNAVISAIVNAKKNGYRSQYVKVPIQEEE